MRKSAKKTPRPSRKRIGHSRVVRSRGRFPGFTLVELLTVMAIIIALAGLVLMSAGWAQKKAASSRAEAEIAAISAACESYKADQGCYPAPAVQVSGSGNYNPSGYQAASRALYQALSGDGGDALVSGTGLSDGKIDAGSAQYMEFKPKMLGGVTAGVVTSTVYVQDPFGYSYGYYAPGPTGATGSGTSAVIYNPTFDLWCTAGSTVAGTATTAGTNGWIKNW